MDGRALIIELRTAQRCGECGNDARCRVRLRTGELVLCVRCLTGIGLAMYETGRRLARRTIGSVRQPSADPADVARRWRTKHRVTLNDRETDERDHDDLDLLCDPATKDALLAARLPHNVDRR